MSGGNYEQNKLDKVRLKLVYVGCKFYDSISRLYFPQNLLPWQPYDAFSCALKIGIYCPASKMGQ